MAPGALALVMMMPPQPSPKSVAIGSTCSSGATSTSCPRARKAAAVRSLSACGRVTTRRMLYFPGHDFIRKPVSTFRDHALADEAGRCVTLDRTPGFGADLDRVGARPARSVFARRIAIRVREQPAEVNRVAGNIGMPADRRLAGAVELGQECALAGDRG